MKEFSNLKVYNQHKIVNSKLLIGIVYKIIDDKTISVMIKKTYLVKKYIKRVAMYKMILVNTSGDFKIKIGDNVLFFFTNKISKKKYTQIFKIL